VDESEDLHVPDLGSGASTVDGARRAGSGQDPRTKRASVLALAIERDIVRAGWPVGAVIGSEAELLACHRVSKAVLREAVRILESRMVARMQRGRGGGLIVAEPDVATVADATALFLEFKRVGVDSIFDARTILELHCTELAAQKIDETGITTLRAILDEETAAEPTAMPVHSHNFHIAVAELSGNEVLCLFVTGLTRLTRERAVLPASVSREAAEVHHAHAAIADAITRGDAALARHRMQVHLRAVATYLP
jgi:DNA-binding FadR family transcriptional regulator